jgi:restriction system protein
VDAVIFDPDPLHGGKYVVPAKRYNNVVDVSAVGDLWGTVLNEGAARGILVTTTNMEEMHTISLPINRSRSLMGKIC